MILPLFERFAVNWVPPHFGHASHRSAGRLVTVTAGGGLYLPTFQLDEALELDKRAAAINLRLHRVGMDGWATWDWWSIRSPWVDPARPTFSPPPATTTRRRLSGWKAAVEGLLVEPG